VQSSWAADSIEPQPDKAKVAINAIADKGRNVDEFIPPSLLDSELKLERNFLEGSEIKKEVNYSYSYKASDLARALFQKCLGRSWKADLLLPHIGKGVNDGLLINTRLSKWLIR
jgi:hypothetical protein